MRQLWNPLRAKRVMYAATSLAGVGTMAVGGLYWMAMPYSYNFVASMVFPAKKEEKH